MSVLKRSSLASKLKYQKSLCGSWIIFLPLSFKIDQFPMLRNYGVKWIILNIKFSVKCLYDVDNTF